MPRGVKRRALQEFLSEPIYVAVLGSGGREHALARKIAESPLCKGVFVLPGNPGMVDPVHRIRTEAADVNDPQALSERLAELEVDLVVVGPDDLLAAGVVDALEAAGFAVFGPSQAAARLEWSKAFAKQVMAQAEIPTAKYFEITADSVSSFQSRVAELGGYPLVLKYDGLALGKGVRICAEPHEADEFLVEVFEQKRFHRAKSGEAPVVVAEQFISGHEVSLFALTDGSHYAVLEPACDYKRLLDANRGPNTGGMGAYSPVPWLYPENVRAMADRVFGPVLAKMREAGSAFKGLLYAGLIVRGTEFWVLEFNARFGDPETQVLLPRLESDLLPLLYGCAVGALERHQDMYPLRWSPMACVTVVAASRGYPEKPETGFEVTHDFRIGGDVLVYYAGVRGAEDKLVTSGGRVLSLSCLDSTLDLARRKALSLMEKTHFEGMHYRRDIGSMGPDIEP